MKKHRYIVFLLFFLCLFTLNGHGQNRVSSKWDSLKLRVHHYFSKLDIGHRKYFQQNAEDSLNLKNYTKYAGDFKLKDGMKVFGWHPYWMANSYNKYNYSLLTHVSYFSCDVDPNSGNLTLNGWDTTSFVRVVKAQNPSCKVLLNVTCFGEGPISTFLNSETAKNTFFKNIILTVTKKGADGVCIDFEGIPATEHAKFSSFIASLKDAFKSKGLLVVITLPAVDTNPSPFDFGLLTKSVDLFILMGYDYFGSFSDKTGPVAPIVPSPNWISSHIESSTDYYLHKNVPNSLLLLGVPYYGAIWETENAAIPSAKITKFIGYRSYSYALSSLGNFKDTASLKASYYCYPLKSNNKVYRQFWLDGVYSLGEKYDYVLTKKLGGIAIWALGFDDGSDNLWKLLETKFTNGQQDFATMNNSDSHAGLSDNSIATQDTVKTNEGILANVKHVVVIAKTKPAIVTFSTALVMLTLLLVLLKVLSVPGNVTKLRASGLYYLLLIVVVILAIAEIGAMYIYCFSPHYVAFFVPLAVIVIACVFFRFYKIRSQKEMP